MIIVNECPFIPNNLNVLWDKGGKLNKVKTWWIPKNVVTLHPLFVAPVPEALSLT